MMHMDMSIDLVTLGLAAAGAIVYVVRLEGKLKIFQLMLKNVNDKVNILEGRYNFDGKYTVTEHYRPRHPAE